MLNARSLAKCARVAFFWGSQKMNRQTRSTLVFFTAVSFLLLAFSAPVWAADLRIYFPDIEQGSSTLIVSPTGHALLVDGGSGIRSADDDIAAFVKNLIDVGVVTSLDFVVATHYDEDHIGRLEDVLNAGLMAPGGMVLDRGDLGGTPNTFAFSDYVAAANSHNRTTITPNTTLDLGGGALVHCLVVNGQLPDGSSVDISASNQFENSASVGLLVEFGNFQFWVAGDLTGNEAQSVSPVEAAVAPFIGDVDVYTFHHHGSRTSSTPAFLGSIKAEVGICQNSVDNDFGHPNSEIVTNFLNAQDTFGNVPFFFQQNPGNPGDTRSDDGLADGIADTDDMTEVIGLPGTITLVSDGDSYQVYGGGISPLTLPADQGSGVVGDFPPSLLQVSRSPLVPLSTQAVAVQAQVQDEGAVSVEIRYDLDGVAQTPIPMALAGGAYQANIPAQSDGVQVAFRVVATDLLGQVTYSELGGYYSGVTPISTIRVNDANGLLQTAGFAVRVEGNITVEPGIFHPFVSQIYVQDASQSGVQVFDRTLEPVGRGDVVQFVGELEQFNGQTEISVAEPFGNFGFTLIGPGTVPAPQVVTVADVGEALEGRLVRINNLTVTAGQIPATGNGNLTVTDDGGLHTATIRIDGDTDIPGANTPVGAFDVIGVVAQSDGTFPYLSFFQITPRERTDFLTNEVNLPVLLINEIHADPDPLAGDANGDGSISSTQDEFLELVNTTTAALDISGFTVSDGVGVRHVFPNGTIVPAREAVVVFGGGSPSGAFGNAAANGLVFTASSGTLGLNNGGDTVTVSDDLGVAIQSVSYGAEGGQNESLVRQPDLTNTAFVLHSVANPSLLYSPGARSGGEPFTVAVGALLLTEVMYDPSGADDGLEWVELFNNTAFPIDLSGLSLGNGGSDYTSSLVQLSGTVGPGQTFVVGGPTSNASNGSPVYDLVLNFSPDFQNSGTTADGVALFNVPAGNVNAATIPIDAVVYGVSNDNGLIDETGSANAPEVGDAPTGASLERIDLAGNWQIQLSPNPNSFLTSNNHPPVADPQDVTTDEGVPAPITLTGSDLDNDPLQFAIDTPPSNGSLSGTAPDLVYTPDPGFSGSDSFTFVVNDGQATSAPAIVSITVNPAPVNTILLSEVFYDAAGSDNGLEWVELYNDSNVSVDLSGYSLGAGGSDYTTTKVQLSGVIGPHQTFVIGGPTSNASNANPVFDWVANFSPDLQNSGSTADGVALFNVPASQVDSTTVPVDAVVYGGANTSNLIDETGSANAPEVGDAPAGSSIERVTLAGAWQVQGAPTPNASPL